MYVEKTPEGYNIIGISLGLMKVLQASLVLYYTMTTAKNITAESKHLVQQIDRELVNTGQ